MDGTDRQNGPDPAGHSRYAAEFKLATHDSKPASDPPDPKSAPTLALAGVSQRQGKSMAQPGQPMHRELHQQGNPGPGYQGLHNRSSYEWRRPQPQSYVTQWYHDHYHHRVAEHTPPRADAQFQEGYYHHRTPAHAQGLNSNVLSAPETTYPNSQNPLLQLGLEQQQLRTDKLHEYYHARGPSC